MKIYFAGSIRAGRQDIKKYAEIINYLKGYGQVLTEHVGKENLDEVEKNMTDQHIYEQDMKWMKESDVLIADITVASIGVGYEIAKGEDMGKKILCICKKPEEGKQISAMIAGDKNIKTEFYETFEDIKNILDNFLKKV